MVVFCTQNPPLLSSPLLSSPLLSSPLLSSPLLSFCVLSSLPAYIPLLPSNQHLLLPSALIFPPLISLLLFCKYRRGDTTWLRLTTRRLTIRPLPYSLSCGGIHIHYVAPLSPPPSLSVFSPAFFFFALHLCLFLPLPLSPSLSGSPLRSVSLSPCLCGPPLGWLLLAAPVPPTLSLDMLFIGLQRGWLSVQGGCCLKQCSLNKRGKISRRALWCSLSASVYRHRAPRSPMSPPTTVSHRGC